MEKMRKVSKAAQQTRYVIADWLSACVAFFVFNIIRYYLLKEFQNGYTDLRSFIFSTKLIIEQAIVPVAVLGIYWLSGYYNNPFGKSRLQEFSTTFFSEVVNTILIYLILLINDQTGRRTVNYEMILMLFGLFFIFTYILRLSITSFAIRNFKAHAWDFRILVIGNSKTARKIASRLKKGPSRVSYNVVGFVRLPGENSVNDKAKIYNFDKIDVAVNELKVDQFVIVPEVFEETKVLSIIYNLFHYNLPIKISPDIFSFLTSGIRLKDIYGEPFIDLTTPSISESSKNIKRSLDFIISFLVLILFSPLFLIIGILVKRSSPGPIIYSQQRIGLLQRPFNIYKFRTMVNDAENDGPRLSSSNDERITKVGRWLRKYRLDEIPQFWNVLKGDMSIVGPRPEREYYIKQIVKEAPYYALVCQIKPGITSWGMVKYGYASNVRQMVERTRYDLIYLSNMSLFVDFKILIYTVKTVITGRGV